MARQKHDIYVQKNVLEQLGRLSEENKITKSAVISKLFSDMGIGNKDIKPVVLHVPVNLTQGNKAALRYWLEQKAKGIMNLFYGD